MIKNILDIKPERSFRGFRGIIEVKHSITGRVRFFIPSLKNDPQKCQHLKQQLEQTDIIINIAPNSMIGSVLILFDHDRITIETLTAVVARLLDLEAEIEKKPTSLVQQELSDLFKSVDSAIYQYSSGVFDLNSLIAGLFFSVGFLSIARKSNLLPPGTSFIYWAYNMIKNNSGR